MPVGADPGSAGLPIEPVTCAGTRDCEGVPGMLGS